MILAHLLQLSSNSPSVVCQVEKLVALYDELSGLAPRARAPKRILLDILPAGHSRFKPTLDKYLRAGLRKGVPSLFADVRPLYRHSGKKEVIDALLNTYLEGLKSSEARLPVSTAEEEEPSEEAPTTLLWTLFFAAQHKDRLHDYEKGLELIEEAIGHTPTVVELYMTKAKILKHKHDLGAACLALEVARNLDQADRYINKYAS